MRGDARGFATDHANRFAAWGEFPTHQLLDREGVGDIIRERREVIEPVGVRHELVVLHVFRDLLVATVQVANLWRRLRHQFAIELQHKTQNAMRRRVRWAHVDDHLFADLAFVRRRLGLCLHAAGEGVRRFDFTSLGRHS